MFGQRGGEGPPDGAACSGGVVHAAADCEHISDFVPYFVYIS